MLIPIEIGDPGGWIPDFNRDQRNDMFWSVQE